MPKYGEKIRSFGLKRYDTVKDLAEALDMKPPSLQKYLQGDIAPGQVLLDRLRKMGCDLNWLFDDNDINMVENLIIERLAEENKRLRKRVEELEKHIGYTSNSLLKVAEENIGYGKKK